MATLVSDYGVILSPSVKSAPESPTFSIGVSGSLTTLARPTFSILSSPMFSLLLAPPLDIRLQSQIALLALYSTLNYQKGAS